MQRNKKCILRSVPHILSLSRHRCNESKHMSRYHHTTYRATCHSALPVTTKQASGARKTQENHVNREKSHSLESFFLFKFIRQWLDSHTARPMPVHGYYVALCLSSSAGSLTTISRCRCVHTQRTFSSSAVPVEWRIYFRAIDCRASCLSAVAWSGSMIVAAAAYPCVFLIISVSWFSPALMKLATFATQRKHRYLNNIIILCVRTWAFYPSSITSQSAFGRYWSTNVLRDSLLTLIQRTDEFNCDSLRFNRFWLNKRKKSI